MYGHTPPHERRQAVFRQWLLAFLPRLDRRGWCPATAIPAHGVCVRQDNLGPTAGFPTPHATARLRVRQCAVNYYAEEALAIDAADDRRGREPEAMIADVEWLQPNSRLADQSVKEMKTAAKIRVLALVELASDQLLRQGSRAKLRRALTCAINPNRCMLPRHARQHPYSLNLSSLASRASSNKHAPTTPPHTTSTSAHASLARQVVEVRRKLRASRTRRVGNDFETGLTVTHTPSMLVTCAAPGSR